MKKTFFFIIILAFVILGAVFVFPKYKAVAPTHDTATQGVSDYKNATYEVDGQQVTLKDGFAEVTTPGLLSTVRTQYFGNEAKGDVNNDGKEDVSFFLNQNGGGTGTFYFVTVALKVDGGYKGLNSIFLGDRIAPQNTEIKNGIITVNYADRLPDEPFTTKPSVGVSRYFKVENEKLVEIKGEMGDGN